MNYLVFADDPLLASLSFDCAHALSRFDVIDRQANNLKAGSSTWGFQ